MLQDNRALTILSSQLSARKLISSVWERTKAHLLASNTEVLKELVYCFSTRLEKAVSIKSDSLAKACQAPESCLVFQAFIR